MTANLTPEQAESLEAAFLGGLEEAQFAYERIVEHEAWKLLGFDRFADWWDERVTPTMHALSMRPTREIAAAVVERVREEEAVLPPAQRRTRRELAEMVGVHPDTISGRKRQDPDKAEVPPTPDLDEPKPVDLPNGQEHAAASLAAIDKATAAVAEVDHTETDARLTAELDEIMSGTDVRFRRNFAETKVKARQLFEFDVDRINNLFAGNWDRDVGDLLNAFEDWIGRVRDDRKTKQRGNFRVVNGGLA